MPDTILWLRQEHVLVQIAAKHRDKAIMTTINQKHVSEKKGFCSALSPNCCHQACRQGLNQNLRKDTRILSRLNYLPVVSRP